MIVCGMCVYLKYTKKNDLLVFYFPINIQKFYILYIKVATGLCVQNNSLKIVSKDKLF